MTWDGENVSIYINGQLEGFDNLGGSIGDGEAFIGQHITAGQYFQGEIDDLRIYNGSLSGESIMSIVKQYSEPDMPTNLTITQNSLSALFSWKAPFNGNSTILYYNVYRSENSTDNFELIGSAPLPIYVDSTVKEDLDYYYRVTAVNAIGEGAVSETVTIHIAKMTIPNIGDTNSTGTIGFNLPLPTLPFYIAILAILTINRKRNK